MEIINWLKEGVALLEREFVKYGLIDPSKHTSGKTVISPTSSSEKVDIQEIVQPGPEGNSNLLFERDKKKTCESKELVSDSKPEKFEVTAYKTNTQLNSSASPDLDNVDSDDYGWPLELVLVRHGHSEGNEAVNRSSRNDLSAYTPEFKKKHSSTYRLTDKGIMQAQIAGKWIRENIGEVFDRYYTSEYVRAMETSAYLNLPNAKWYTEIVLRERDKGWLDNTSHADKKHLFADELERRKRDAFFWAPPGGESLANVCIRVEHTFATLRRECSNQKVIIVCHGEVMWAFRVRIEKLSQIRFHQLKASSDPKDRIHNAQILHYSRIDPVTNKVWPYFRFMRSNCPWNQEYSSGSWIEFERPTYTNEELMNSAQLVPRYVNSDYLINLKTEEESDL
ncbi:uncharacterized protein LOC126316776 [Schistocerca gregaria]|uniref:uncharacterized protein LOC126316776 n=1 Tax=Schistocerca gregaria TaxID=7010 RepID=UPI00211E853C|nr:uncharacterized protein LOC126316776 [Schistocerca gregaria]